MWACFLSQLGMGFNLVIMPLFWYMLAPELFKLDWHGIQLITNIHLIITHTIPFISSVTNVYLTKGFVMLPRDYKSILGCGMIYIYANYIGHIEEGKPLYPISFANWVEFWPTVGWYTVLAVLEAGCYWLFATLLCKYRNFKPT